MLWLTVQYSEKFLSQMLFVISISGFYIKFNNRVFKYEAKTKKLNAV